MKYYVWRSCRQQVLFTWNKLAGFVQASDIAYQGFVLGHVKLRHARTMHLCVSHITHARATKHTQTLSSHHVHFRTKHVTQPVHQILHYYALHGMVDRYTWQHNAHGSTAWLMPAWAAVFQDLYPRTQSSTRLCTEQMWEDPLHYAWLVHGLCMAIESDDWSIKIEWTQAPNLASYSTSPWVRLATLPSDWVFLLVLELLISNMILYIGPACRRKLLSAKSMCIGAADKSDNSPLAVSSGTST